MIGVLIKGDKAFITCKQNLLILLLPRIYFKLYITLQLIPFNGFPIISIFKNKLSRNMVESSDEKNKIKITGHLPE